MRATDTVPDLTRAHREDFVETLEGRDEPLGAPGGAHKVGPLGVDTPMVAAR